MAKTVLITGSSSGIGASCALEFAKLGYNIVINYLHNETKAKKLQEDIIANYPVEVLIVAADISKESDVEKMFETINHTFMGLDVLVNNAGICHDTPMFDKDLKDFKHILEVNVIGTYLCSKYASKYMTTGSIINVSSTNGLDTTYPESCDYDASKAGVISLTHNLAKELSPNIRVNSVAPGWVDTPMNKDLSIDQINHEEKHILLQRFAQPEEIAKVIVFLASSSASYINDSIIRVDGGISE
jgi:3-oxoacyl-[acyl-carrier protein] reductase